MREYLDTFGKRQADQNIERIPFYGFDTLLFAQEGTNDYAVIKRQKIFNPSDKKSDHLKTNDFPLFQRACTITGMSAVHNISFPNPTKLAAFENLAKIKVNINDVDYSDIPLSTLLRYNRVPVGSEAAAFDIISKVPNLAADPASPANNEIWYNTTTKQLKLYAGASVGTVILNSTVQELNSLQYKGGNYSVLQEEIKMPEGGKISLTFDPSLENLITDSINKYGSEIANDGKKYFYIIISYFGFIDRER